jgi:hypothetical protein
VPLPASLQVFVDLVLHHELVGPVAHLIRDVALFCESSYVCHIGAFALWFSRELTESMAFVNPRGDGWDELVVRRANLPVLPLREKHEFCDLLLQSLHDLLDLLFY